MLLYIKQQFRPAKSSLGKKGGIVICESSHMVAAPLFETPLKKVVRQDNALL
jgi:hypothetical protein